jgi:MFS family permease
LPNFLSEIIDSSTSSYKISVSALYTIRYLFIALALLISGNIAERRGSRMLLLLGGALVLGAMMLLVFAPRYEVLIGIQAMLGFGEGMFLIAVQSYILRIATSAQRTKGAAMLVNNTYGGALSGTAIGALLVIDPRIQEPGVFFIGGLVIVFLLYYILRIIPNIAGEDFSEKQEQEEEVARADEYGTVILSKEELRKAYELSDTELEFDRTALGATLSEEQKKAQAMTNRGGFVSALVDLDFLKTAILIGIPVKIVWTGVFNANLPIILERQNFPTEDVSQIMMLYIAGVLITSGLIARITDWLGKTKLVLFLGALGSGIGLFLIGLLGSQDLVGFIGRSVNEQTALSLNQNATFLGTLLLITGMTILGFSQGFIQAPSITHVAKTKAANKMGKSAAASIYRLFERAGQVLGPIIVGAMLVASDFSILTVSIIGVFVFLFGWLFLLPSRLPSFLRRKVNAKQKA